MQSPITDNRNQALNHPAQPRPAGVLVDGHIRSSFSQTGKPSSSKAAAAAFRHREGSITKGSSRSRKQKTTDDQRCATNPPTGGGIVFHPTTIAKVAEEFKYRREQVRNLANALQDKEHTIVKLRSRIEKIQNEFVSYKSTVQRERQTRIQSIDEETTKNRNEQIINQYKRQLHIQSKELDEIRNELLATRKREVELSIDLDIHDFKFISYQKHQRVLDLDGIENMDEINNNNPNGTTVVNHPKFSTHIDNAQQQQYYIQKLTTDYEKMEKLYVKSRMDASDKIELLGGKLQVANSKIQRLQHSVVAFQHQQKSKEVHSNPNMNIDVTFDSSAAATAITTTSFDTTAPLSFESDVAADEYMLGVTAATTTTQANHATYKSVTTATTKYDHSSYGSELTSLRIENHGLIQKVSALQIELSLLEENIDNTARLKRYKMLEKNIDEYIADIMRLEEQLRMKERIIHRISSQLLEERLAKVKNPLDYEQTSISSSLITQVTSNKKGGEEKDDGDGNSIEEEEINVKYVNMTKKKIKKQKSPHGFIDNTSTVGIRNPHSTLLVDMESQLTLLLEQIKRKDDLLKYVQGKYSAKVAQLKLLVEKDSYYMPPKHKPDFYFI